jgi:hypothetical protein
MGPTGLEFGNPLGFLSPTWNRQLNVWELGSLVNFRLVRLEFPNGTTTERYDTLVFPFQFASQENVLDYLFLGGFYAKNPVEYSPGIIGGFFGRVGFLQVSLELDYNFDTEKMGAVVGVIDTF